ncbi:hypothetical protein [Thalassospira sp. GB04J01]|uniref:hypothetical protein n=1 Tax=Thalassospira sp. GB04J01 TaxID=1485225 RepID=UPI0011AFA47D|nr:hypothetical protein [Thalassospira sp. GB04J01]
MILFLSLSHTRVYAGEYYIDIDGEYVNKSDLFIKKENFNEIFAVYGKGVSYFILSFIESFVLGNGVVSLDDNGSPFVFWFSSSDSDRNKIYKVMKNSDYFYIGKFSEKLLIEKDCLIVGISSEDGELLSFLMYVVNGEYYSYYKCIKDYKNSVDELLIE